jgi:hypothetical protein
VIWLRHDVCGHHPEMKLERSPADPYLLFGVLVLLVASIFGFIFFAQRQKELGFDHQFTEADVAKTEADIKNHYESKGFTVEQVSMVRESSRRLSGFVKVRKSSGLLKPEFTKNCVATMDADAAKYIWECK